MKAAVHYCLPSGDSSDESDTQGIGGRVLADRDDLPYRVEVWDETEAFVDRVVAVSLSAAIGYAAYYAAVREFPGRTITLRHKGHTIGRWSGRAH